MPHAGPCARHSCHVSIHSDQRWSEKSRAGLRYTAPTEFQSTPTSAGRRNSSSGSSSIRSRVSIHSDQRWSEKYSGSGVDLSAGLFQSTPTSAGGEISYRRVAVAGFWSVSIHSDQRWSEKYWSAGPSIRGMRFQSTPTSAGRRNKSVALGGPEVICFNPLRPALVGEIPDLGTGSMACEFQSTPTSAGRRNARTISQTHTGVFQSTPTSAGRRNLAGLTYTDAATEFQSTPTSAGRRNAPMTVLTIKATCFNPLRPALVGEI